MLHEAAEVTKEESADDISEEIESARRFFTVTPIETAVEGTTRYDATAEALASAAVMLLLQL